MKRSKVLLITLILVPVIVLGILFAVVTNRQGWFAKEEEAFTGDSYTFVVVGDTQALNEFYPQKLSALYDWIVENEEKENIAFVFGLGDITESYKAPATNQIEFSRAEAEFQKLLDAKIPFSLTRGNHDLPGIYVSNITYEEYGDMTYGGTSSIVKEAGSFDDTMKNTWQKLEICGQKYLFINMDIGVTATVLGNINAFIEENAQYRVIITTHIYLSCGQEANGYVPTYVSGSSIKTYYGANIDFMARGGQYLWDECFSKHENIEIVLCGHSPCPRIDYWAQEGENGNMVNQFLIDPQAMDLPVTEDPTRGQDGLGMVALFRFSNNGDILDVEYYSTDRNEYLEDSCYTVDLTEGKKIFKEDAGNSSEAASDATTGS